MKQLSLLITALLLAVMMPATPARAETNVSIDFFYDALSPHGDWIYSDNYGYVWQPTAAGQSDWAPYTDGYWSYTDGGWTWISNEDFGWATYHYGRWIRLDNFWTWVPGYEWAPAWVSWRQTEDDHVGWAPLPPEATWSTSIGVSRWADSYYDIGPAFYNFVPLRLFGRRTSLRPIIIDRSRNVTYIDRSVNITNISYRTNVVNNIFVGGPDPDRIDRISESPIRRLRLQRDDQRFRRDWLGPRGDRGRDPRSLSRIENDDLFVAAPGIRREDSPRLPSRVRERLERGEVDRGWRSASGDASVLQSIRERQRNELEKNRPDNLPPKRPTLVTGQVPPPAVGRVLRPEERRAGVRRPGPGETEESVRRAQPNDADPRDPRDNPPGPGDRPDRRSSDMDRDGRPGPDGRTPGTIPGRPGLDERDGRPGSDRRGPDGRPDRPGMPDRDRDRDRSTDSDRRPGMPDRDGNDRAPGVVPGRPGVERDGLPGSSGDARRPDNRPDSTPERRPGVKPEEAPRPRLAPGVVPQEESRRPGGAPDSRPSPPRKEDMPPAPRAEPNQPPKRPESRPSLPDRKPDMPKTERNRPDSAPPARKPAPMPEPRRDTAPKSAPMPKAQPKERPSPMPRPERPAPSASRKADSPDVRAARPSRPAPEPVKKSSVSKPASKPPQVSKPAAAPKPRAAAPKMNNKSAVPKARPKAPAPAKKPAAKKTAKKEKD